MNYSIQALLATIFTWGITALGAGLVFFFKKINKTLLDAMLGIAAGVMIAASFFSLISPALEMADNLKMTPIISVSLGFIGGGLLLYIGDKIFNKIQSKKTDNMKRVTLLISSITLHNIPEGLAIGVAFGSVAYGLDGATLSSAYLLALGIGIQNFPEGTAVSVPLLRENFSKRKAFFYGQLSAIVEPIFGFIGALLVIKIRYILPFCLSFAAGAMIYVVVQELIPESQTNENKSLMAFWTLIGFLIMMFLDVTLG